MVDLMARALVHSKDSMFLSDHSDVFGEIPPAPCDCLLVQEEIRRILQSNQSEKGHEQDVLERYLLDVQCEFGCCLTACGNHLFACGTVYPQFF